jgi:hypothetical protein
MSSERRSLFLAVMLSAAVAPAVRGAGADAGLVRVDISRAGSDGPMNGVACIITITGEAKGAVCHEVIRAEANKQLSGGKATVLLAGDRVICELHPSNGIQAFTPRALRPDGLAPGASAWAPTTFTPRARAGQTVELGIVPKRRGSTYLGGWLVRREPRARTDHGAN